MVTAAAARRVGGFTRNGATGGARCRLGPPCGREALRRSLTESCRLNAPDRSTRRCEPPGGATLHKRNDFFLQWHRRLSSCRRTCGPHGGKRWRCALAAAICAAASSSSRWMSCGRTRWPHDTNLKGKALLVLLLGTLKVPAVALMALVHSETTQLRRLLPAGGRGGGARHDDGSVSELQQTPWPQWPWIKTQQRRSLLARRRRRARRRRSSGLHRAAVDDAGARGANST